MSEFCIRCRVVGRVQGVFFRHSTRQVAEKLGITGYAINLDNGSVEVLACGNKQALSELKVFLHEGPQQAQVDEVVCHPVEKMTHSGFSTG